MKPLANRVYDVLKWLVVIVLPAVGSLYTGLSQIWQLPYASEIPATIMVICTFLGAVLCISTAQYNKEQEDFTDDPYLYTASDDDDLIL